MNDARFLKIQKDFYDAGRLVTAYAIQTQQPMRNAFNELRNAGMVYDFDNVMNEGLAYSKIMIAKDGVLSGMQSEGISRLGTKHIMGSARDIRASFHERKIMQPRLNESPEACRIFERAIERIERQHDSIPLGLMGPVYERVARKMEDEWEASGRRDKAAFRSARTLMTFALTHAAGYVEVEDHKLAEQRRPGNILRNVAKKITGRASNVEDQKVLDLSIWEEPTDPFRPPEAEPVIENRLGQPN